MLERRSLLSLAAGALTVAAMLAAAPAALSQKIVCWKDKTGKVIGCGDRVPPEYQQNESKTLDSRGITRQTTVSAQEAARLKEEEQKKAAAKAEEDRRLAEQRRQDTALINTYASTKEIDVRRDRELQVVDLQIQQLNTSLKSASAALETQQKRHANFEKSGKPVPDGVKTDLARAQEEKTRVEAQIAGKEKDKARISASYAQQKTRYLELKGAPAPAPSTPPAKPAPKQ